VSILLSSLLADPNVLYLLLIGSIWLAAVAVTVPGTGALEVVALVCAVVVVLLLTAMPTQWLSVLLIALGVLGYQIVPFLIRRGRWAVIALGMSAQVIASLFLFDGQPVSLLVIAAVLVASLVYQRFILTPAYQSRHLEPAMLGDQPLIGEPGIVQNTIDPVGIVRVRGESWTARGGMRMEPGTPVVVVEQEGLTLFVRPEKPKRNPEWLQPGDS